MKVAMRDREVECAISGGTMSASHSGRASASGSLQVTPANRTMFHITFERNKMWHFRMT